MTGIFNPMPQFTIEGQLASDETQLETTKTLLLGLIEMRDRADVATLRGCRRALKRYRNQCNYGFSYSAITACKHAVEDQITLALKAHPLCTLEESILHDIDGTIADELDNGALGLLREYFDGQLAYDELPLWT